MLYRWRKELREDSQEAFPGRGNLKASDDEIQRLLRERAQLQEEIAILKAAQQFFNNQNN